MEFVLFGMIFAYFIPGFLKPLTTLIKKMEETKMKTKKIGKKLVLNKETIVAFDQKSLGMVRGGQQLWTEGACPPEQTDTCQLCVTRMEPGVCNSQHLKIDCW